MHENIPVLAVTPRERLGTRYSNRLRKQGKLPAVVYGHKQDPVSIALDSRDTLAHIKAGEKIFNLDFPGRSNKDEGQMVLLKDLQFDYLGTNIVHADFARVDLNERVKTFVAIHLIGEAIGLKQAGAILMHPVAEIEVECAVKDIPDFIEVNINELDVGKAITAGDVKLPVKDMKLLTDSHGMVAQIVIQQEIVVAEAAAVDAAAEPEVLTAKKPAEGEEAAAGAKGAAAGKDAKAPAAAKGAAPAKDAKAAAPAKDAKAAAPKK